LLELLQQLLELGTFWLLPLLSFFLLRLLLPLLQLLPRLLLALLLLSLPLLLDRAKPDGLGCPLRDGRGLDLLVHRAGVLRRPVATGPITYGDRIPLDPRSGRLGGSLLLEVPRPTSTMVGWTPPSMGEVGCSRHQSAAEGRRSL